MNETINNIYNFTIQKSVELQGNFENGIVTVPFSAIITQCQQWINYSALSHNTYIIPIIIYYVAKVIKRFIYNPNWRLKIKGIWYDFYWFDELQDACRLYLFLRIIQVWYIMNYML